MDNASTDATAQVAMSYARNDDRIRYYRSEHFVPAAENWIRAFEKLDKKDSAFFMWAGDDDLWNPSYIERLLEPLLKDRRCVLSFSDYRQIDLEGSVVKSNCFGGRSWASRSALESFRWLMAQGGGHCAICGVMRLDALTWTPVFLDTSFGGDLWFILRLAAAGQLAYANAVLFSKRLGGISTTGSDASARMDERSIWNIGGDEWTMIDGLAVPFVAKAYIYARLTIAAKMLFPSKPIDFYLWPWFAAEMLRVNKRGLGLRTRLKSKLVGS